MVVPKCGKARGGEGRLKGGKKRHLLKCDTTMNNILSYSLVSAVPPSGGGVGTRKRGKR